MREIRPKEVHLRWPSSMAVSLLAGLTTWITMWAWVGFVETASDFLGPALGGCLIVAVSGMLMRSARVPILLVPLGQIALLGIWLSRTWAVELMLGGWVPTPESLREVGVRVQDGVAAAQAFAAPVPEGEPAIHALLIVAGVSTAVVVDFLACGIRRVPLAGLPLLAVYTAPVSILDGGVPWGGFAVAAMSFLFLIASDQARRLSHWGRQISGTKLMFDSPDTDVSTAAVRSSARKIGFTATGLAVILPIFIPTLGTSLIGGGGPGSGGGGDAVSINNPIVDLKRDLTRGRDVDLLWVTTPEADPSYLRISVLDDFDGTRWSPSGREIPAEQSASGRMPDPPGLESDVPRTEVPYDIEIGSEFESKWLPTPYPVSAISAEVDWRYDLGTFDFVSADDGQTTRNLDYSLRALRVEPTAAMLAASGAAPEKIFTPYTELPSSLPDFVRSLTRDLTDDKTSKFEKAVALQEWFREDGGFTYSLDRSAGNGLDALEEFLGNGPSSRIGYCEQFASAMAIMGRSIGIPSRVAVGFLRPERAEGDTYVYSAHDLHAWPEMYFEGTGWVLLEPTPAVRADGVPGYTSQQVPSGRPNDSTSSTAPNQNPNRLDPGVPITPSGGSGNADTGSASGVLAGFFGSILVLGGLGAPRLTRSMVRSRRWARAQEPVDVAEAAWSELRDSALDLRVPWDDSTTLRIRARSLLGSFGEPVDPGRHRDDTLTRTPLTGPSANPLATDALQRLVKFVERARYAPSVEMQDVTDDVELCVQALRDGAARKRRWRAVWLPVSLVTSLPSSLATSLPASLVTGLSRDMLRRRIHKDVAEVSEPGVDHAI